MEKLYRSTQTVRKGRSRMAKNKNILLIWDIDGTLLTCKGSGKRSMTQAFLDMFGVQNGFDGVNMAGRVDRSIVTEACEKHGIFEYDIDAFYKLYSQCLDNDMKDNHKAKVLDGVEHILKRTHESSQFFNVIGTGNCEQGAWLKLKHLNLDSYFDTGGFGTHVIERKHVIKHALDNARKHYNMDFIDLENVFVVGDTPADVICSKKLNLKSVAIATGGYTMSVLESYKPDYLLASLDKPQSFLNIFE